jgi:hypothetical protein
MPQPVKAEIGSAGGIIGTETLRTVGGGIDARGLFDYAYGRLVICNCITGIVIGAIVIRVAVATVVWIIAVPVAAIGQCTARCNTDRDAGITRKASVSTAAECVSTAAEFPAASGLRLGELSIAPLRDLRITAACEISSADIRLAATEIRLSAWLSSSEICLWCATYPRTAEISAACAHARSSAAMFLR